MNDLDYREPTAPSTLGCKRPSITEQLEFQRKEGSDRDAKLDKLQRLLQQNPQLQEILDLLLELGLR